MFPDSSPNIFAQSGSSCFEPQLHNVQISNELPPKPQNRGQNHSKTVVQDSLTKGQKGVGQKHMKRQYKKKPRKDLWMGFMEAVVQKNLIFVSWKYKLKVDLFKLISQNLGNVSRKDVKSWNNHQKKKYFIGQGIDMLQAIQMNVKEFIDDGEIQEPRLLQKFEEFQELLRKRDEISELLSQEKKEAKNCRKMMKGHIKSLFCNKQQVNSQKNVLPEQKIEQWNQSEIQSNFIAEFFS